MNHAHRSVLRRGFTLIELLVVIAIISVLSGLVVPSLIAARERAQLVQCTNHLKQIYAFALIYSDLHGRGSFPIGSGKEPSAHESLGELLRVDSKDLLPALFTCPADSASVAPLVEDGSFVLDAESCSYAWTARKTKNTAGRKPLCSDRYVEGYEDEDGTHSGHRGGVNVLYTDGSVAFVAAKDLDPETMLPPGLKR